MNIEVNSERSYLGKDIKAWCMSDTEDANALEINLCSGATADFYKTHYYG